MKQIMDYSVASAIGLPLGTILGDSLGWRVSFLLVAFFGA
jgi:predicted MFS family arabinose efflux permease